MSEKFSLAYPLIARFLTAHELGPLLLTCKSWNAALSSSLCEIYFDGEYIPQKSSLLSFIQCFRGAKALHLANVTDLDIRAEYLLSRFSFIAVSQSSFLGNNHGGTELDFVCNLKTLQCRECLDTTVQTTYFVSNIIRIESLISLRIVGAYHVTDEGVEAILSHCFNLTTIHISSSFYITAPRCGHGYNIQSLALVKCPLLAFDAGRMISSAENITAIWPRYLTALDLSFTGATSNSLSFILQNLPETTSSLTLLQCMSLKGHVNIVSRTLTNLILRQCVCITSINIEWHELQALDLSLCTNLRSLRLFSSSLKVLNLQMLQLLQQICLCCHHLRDLDVSGCSVLFKEEVNRSQSNNAGSGDSVWAAAHVPYLLGIQVQKLADNNPSLDLSKMLSESVGGTVLFEFRQAIWKVLQEAFHRSSH